MIDFEQLIEQTWTSNYKYYVSLGYHFTKCRDKFLVKAKDLPLKSKSNIEVICDYYGKKFYTQHKNYINKNDIIKKDSCNECKYQKVKESNLIKYGTIAPNGVQKTKEELKREFNDRGYDFIDCDIDNFNYKVPIRYICRKHPDNIQETIYDTFKNKNICTQCGIEKRAKNRRATIEEVTEIFAQNNRQLLSKEYTSAKQKLENICLNHPNLIQYSTLAQIKAGYMCKYCEDELTRGENSCHWKGGTTPLHSFLREKMVEWKRQTMVACNYKCVISGNRFDDIHHIYGFNFILEELLQITNLQIKNIGDYSESELNFLIDTCKQLHEKYGDGACINRKIHSLYHKIYGYGSNTPKQFEEFKTRFFNGEFNDQLM
jgi:hypothetical protein